MNPSRSGIGSNNFLDFTVDPPDDIDLSAPEKLTAKTLFTWIKQSCGAGVRTGATLSKKYLYEIFNGDAADPARPNEDPDVFNLPPDSYWDPETSDAYIPSPSKHTPDIPTMEQALLQLPDVDFFFINLGDVDRLAHGSGEQARNGALATADAQVGRLVDALAGRWDSTVLIVLSDHGMDYSPAGPTNIISTQGMLDGLAACFEPMQAVPSGGADLIYVLDRAAPLADRQAALRAARACVLGTQDCDTLCAGTTRPFNAANVAAAWYTVDDATDPDGNMPASLDSKHANGGDLILSAGDGGKFGEPDQSDDGGQIPGNHGHPLTFHNTMLITGGVPWIKKGISIAPSMASPTPFDRLPEQSETIDVAPTVAWLLGLNLSGSDFPDWQELGKGFDGRVLKEAFVQFDADAAAPSPTNCGHF